MNPNFFHPSAFRLWIKTIPNCSSSLKLNFVSYPTELLTKEYIKAANLYFKTFYRNISWINEIRVNNNKFITINKELKIDLTYKTIDPNHIDKVSSFLIKNNIKEAEFKSFLSNHFILIKELEQMFDKDFIQFNKGVISHYEKVR